MIRRCRRVLPRFLPDPRKVRKRPSRLVQDFIITKESVLFRLAQLLQNHEVISTEEAGDITYVPDVVRTAGGREGVRYRKLGPVGPVTLTIVLEPR